MYIQECVPEKLELKISVWTKIIAHVDVDEAVLASSTSCIVPSLISEKLDRREQFIVAHPVREKINLFFYFQPFLFSSRMFFECFRIFIASF